MYILHIYVYMYKFLHCYLYTAKINLNFTFKAYAKKRVGFIGCLTIRKCIKNISYKDYTLDRKR